MSPTERIAQTFPDINSTTGLTVGTAAGIRSFPDPFIAIPSGVDVLIQTGVIFMPFAANPASPQQIAQTLATPVDVTKSFIQYRGMNTRQSSLVLQHWRNRFFFSGIVGGIASSVTVERPVVSTGVSVEADMAYTVVSFLGVGGTSADIRIERGNFSVTPPTTSGSFTLPLPQLTTAELARAFCFCRGIEVNELTAEVGVGTPPSEQPERWHGSFLLINRSFPLPPVTKVEYSAFTLGFTGGANNCGNVDLEVYVTVVVFP